MVLSDTLKYAFQGDAGLQAHDERLRKRIAQLVNILKGKIYSQRLPVEKLLVSSPTDRITFAEAQNLDYRPAKLGEQFGPIWTTFWFRGSVAVPAHWANQRIDLIWISHYCESTLWLDGKVAQGLNFSFGERPEATLTNKAKADKQLEFQIEMACNTAYGAWPPETPYKNALPYFLDQCEVGLFDELAWTIYFDFLVLQQLDADIASTGAHGSKAFNAELLYELNRFANEYEPADRDTWKHAHKILERLYEHRNGTSAHEISAVGEGHLDMAWMWPMAETWRKFIRTSSNQVALMDQYHDYRFVCTQACLYADLQNRQPELYTRVKAKVASHQWIPVGGSWVEPDTNLPAGESLVRQFLFGQRFFEKEFGITAKECWLQDSFGFTAQLPQLMKLAGMTHFVSQKLFYGLLKPQHNVFNWQGLDGSTVLAHLPPITTFSNQLSVSALSKAVKEYADDDLSPRLLVSYGWGDGGGGPTRSMIEIGKRLKDLQGAPKFVMRSPTQFFDLLKADLAKRPATSWTGELYFSRHRGTYTSQGRTKRSMRVTERLLHNLEFVSTVAFKLGTLTYPQQEINELWKTTLLNQHHDIISGTSISVVHETALAELEAVQSGTTALFDRALESLGRDFQRNPVAAAAASPSKSTSSRRIPVNTIGFDRREVTDDAEGKPVQVEALSYGAGKILSQPGTVLLRETGDVISIENDKLLAEFNRSGDLTRLFDKEANREALVSAGNRLQIYDENPVDYDAWEIESFDQASEQSCPAAHACKVHQDPLRSTIEFERKIGRKSTMKQTVKLNAFSSRIEFHCQVNWQEEHKLLKVLFPVAVQAGDATYETQFGAVQRPTHYNTPYDETRFEVVAHKWADLSEHGFGVALLSDCKYGFSVFGNQMRLSLLRAPKAPDPDADIGDNEFAYAIMPHRGGWQDAGVVAEGFKFNYPFQWTSAGASPIDVPSFARINDSNLVIDTIKKAEDSDALVVRLYECHGAHGSARLTCGIPFDKAKFANLLEATSDEAIIVDGTVLIPYHPFQIITLVLK